MLCLCGKFGLSVYMAGPCICLLCLADTCASEVHPVSNPSMYLFIADFPNPDLFV